MAARSSQTFHISPRIVAALLRRYEQEGVRAEYVTDWAVSVTPRGEVTGIAASYPKGEHLPFGVADGHVIVG